MIEYNEGPIKNRQSRETGNTDYTIRRNVLISKFEFFYFSSNFNAIFVKCLYWWAIKKIVYFGKGSNRGPNSEWIVSSAFGSMSTDFLCQCSFKKIESPTLI